MLAKMTTTTMMPTTSHQVLCPDCSHASRISSSLVLKAKEVHQEATQTHRICRTSQCQVARLRQRQYLVSVRQPAGRAIYQVSVPTAARSLSYIRADLLCSQRRARLWISSMADTAGVEGEAIIGEEGTSAVGAEVEAGLIAMAVMAETATLERDASGRTELYLRQCSGSASGNVAYRISSIEQPNGR